MTVKKIKKLIEVFEKSSLSKMKIRDILGAVTLERASAAQPTEFERQIISSTEKAAPVQNAEIGDKIIDFNYLTEVKSPMVGIFYRAPSPDLPPFIEKGRKVKKGDVICIIEAMKVMNEILSEHDGEVVDICAEDGKLVEFSQVLFRIKE